MRDIEFRSWDSEFKDFAYFKEGKYVGSQARTPIKARFNWDNAEQYTGLKDKNGVKIFEGDIVKAIFMENPYLIIWEDLMWCLKSGNELGYMRSDEVEIVGNIYT